MKTKKEVPRVYKKKKHERNMPKPERHAMNSIEMSLYVFVLTEYDLPIGIPSFHGKNSVTHSSPQCFLQYWPMVSVYAQLTVVAPVRSSRNEMRRETIDLLACYWPQSGPGDLFLPFPA